jgi:hypothetical protein
MNCELCGKPGQPHRRGPLTRIFCLKCALHEDLALLIAAAVQLQMGVRISPEEFSPRARRFLARADTPRYQVEEVA